jgi:hypothetical protein
MTTRRVISADVYDLKYDAENRLFEVQKNGSLVASYVYSGDGKRVQSMFYEVPH